MGKDEVLFLVGDIIEEVLQNNLLQEVDYEACLSIYISLTEAKQEKLIHALSKTTVNAAFTQSLKKISNTGSDLHHAIL